MATTIPGMYNATEAAEYLGLTDGMIRMYCREGRLRGQRVGRNWVLTRKELDRFKKIPREVGNPNFKD